MLKLRGKQKRTSLETADKALAKRKLSDLKTKDTRIDLSTGRLPLKDLCAPFLATVQNQRPRTIRRKEDIIQTLLDDFPDGPNCPVFKVRKSAVEAWLASYPFGYASQNLYVQCIKALFALAVDDKIIAESPATTIKAKKRVNPVRITPTLERRFARLRKPDSTRKY